MERMMKTWITRSKFRIKLKVINKNETTRELHFANVQAKLK